MANKELQDLLMNLPDDIEVLLHLNITTYRTIWN